MKAAAVASCVALAGALLGGCAAPITGSSRIGGDTHRVFRGEFEGVQGNNVSGSVNVLGDEAGSRYVELGKNFKLVGAPDPKLGFGAQGEFDYSTVFTVIEEFEGAQTYVIPFQIDVTAFDTVFVWSDELGRVVGKAPLRR